MKKIKNFLQEDNAVEMASDLEIYKKIKFEKEELQKELEYMSNQVMSPKQHEKMKPVRMSYLEKCREEDRLAKKIADLLVRELAG
ncbi:hypothetical protein [Faecalimonas canis]